MSFSFAESTARPRPQTSLPPRSFSPGDQVVRYVDGQPFVCTVIGVEADQKVRVSCIQWPAGYSAPVAPHELTRLPSAG